MEVILYKASVSLITLRGRIFDESTTDILRRGPSLRMFIEAVLNHQPQSNANPELRNKDLFTLFSENPRTRID